MFIFTPPAPSVAGCRAAYHSAMFIFTPPAPSVAGCRAAYHSAMFIFYPPSTLSGRLPRSLP